jgi:hypothetical protein
MKWNNKGNWQNYKLGFNRHWTLVRSQQEWYSIDAHQRWVLCGLVFGGWRGGTINVEPDGLWAWLFKRRQFGGRTCFRVRFGGWWGMLGGWDFLFRLWFLFFLFLELWLCLSFAPCGKGLLMFGTVFAKMTNGQPSPASQDRRGGTVKTNMIR